MPDLYDIVRFTPVWVWALLAFLVALGVAQLRTRRVARARLLILPAVLVLLGLSSTATSFSVTLAALAAWAAAFAAGTGAGRRLPRPAGAAWDAATKTLLLPGSVLPLLLILTIFVLRYAGSVALALHPAWRAELAVALPMSATFGALSGLFLGRALGLLALV